MTVAPLTRAELREELDRSLRHYATKADLANLKFALAAWMLLLVSAATGIIIAVDRLAGRVRFCAPAGPLGQRLP